MSTLATALKGIPSLIKAITVAMAANPLLALASAAAIAGYAVYSAYQDMKEGEEELKIAEQEYHNTLRDTQKTLQDRVDILEVYGQVGIKTSDQIQALSDRDAQSYGKTLDKVLELNQTIVALGNHQRATGSEVVEGYAQAQAQIELTTQAIKDLGARTDEAAKTTNRFSDALLGATLEGKDGVTALRKEFETFNTSNLKDVAQVVTSIGEAGKEAFSKITGSATIVEEALRASLQDKPTEYIQSFLDSMIQVENEAGVTSEAIANAKGAAIQALFDKLSISVDEDLRKADEDLNAAFSAMVEHGSVQSAKLVEVVQSTLGKLATTEGISQFRDNMVGAFDKVGTEAPVVTEALRLIDVKMGAIALSSDLAASALTSAASALGIETVAQATDNYNELTNALAAVKVGFESGEVTQTQYNQAIIANLQSTREYLIGVKGMTEEVANAAVNSSASQNGLQIAISETGRVTELTTALIHDQQVAVQEAYQKTRERIVQDTTDIEALQATSMEAIKVINQEGWGSVGETIKSTFDDAVVAEGVARATMLESQQAFLEASEAGNQALIESTRAQYEEDLITYKSAVQEKNEIAKKSTDLIVENTRKATEEVKKLGEQASYAVFNPFKDLAGLNAQYVAELEDSSQVVQQQVFPTIEAYYQAMSAATRAVQGAKDENRRATATYTRLSEALASTNVPSQQLIANAEASIRSMRTLDQTSLNALQGSIDAAKRKLEDLLNASRQTLQGLRSELAQLRGETDVVENLRYEQRLAELQTQLETARQTQDAATINNLEESLRVLEDIHRTKLRNIQTERQETLKAIREEAAARKQSRGGGNGYATGGYVSGAGTSTSDSILAWLSNGEYVFDAATVKHFGVGFLQSIQNAAKGIGRLKLPSFSTGGAVSSGFKIPSLPTIGGISDSPVKRHEVVLNIGGTKYTGAYSETDADRLIDTLKNLGAAT
jgi:hypothetical protein